MLGAAVVFFASIASALMLVFIIVAAAEHRAYRIPLVAAWWLVLGLMQYDVVAQEETTLELVFDLIASLGSIVGVGLYLFMDRKLLRRDPPSDDGPSLPTDG